MPQMRKAEFLSAHSTHRCCVWPTMVGPRSENLFWHCVPCTISIGSGYSAQITAYCRRRHTQTERLRASAHVMRSRAPPHCTHDTSCHACLTTGRAAQPETPAKDHFRFGDFSVATQASDIQAQKHSHDTCSVYWSDGHALPAASARQDGQQAQSETEMPDNDIGVIEGEQKDGWPHSSRRRSTFCHLATPFGPQCVRLNLREKFIARGCFHNPRQAAPFPAIIDTRGAMATARKAAHDARRQSDALPDASGRHASPAISLPFIAE
jgi:hypothetical protein